MNIERMSSICNEKPFCMSPSAPEQEEKKLNIRGTQVERYPAQKVINAKISIIRINFQKTLACLESYFRAVVIKKMLLPSLSVSFFLTHNLSPLLVS